MIEANDFLQYLRPCRLGEMLDRKAGITPEQRAAMNDAKAKREAETDRIAKSALAKLSGREAEALSDYFTRDC